MEGVQLLWTDGCKETLRYRTDAVTVSITNHKMNTEIEYYMNDMIRHYGALKKCRNDPIHDPRTRLDQGAVGPHNRDAHNANRKRGRIW